MQLVTFLSFMIKLGNYIALPDNSLYIRTRRISSHTNTSFLRILSSLMRTREGLPGRSPIALSKTRLTLEFFFLNGLSEKKLQVIGMSILINPIKPGISHCLLSRPKITCQYMRCAIIRHQCTWPEYWLVRHVSCFTLVEFNFHSYGVVLYQF
jgi:hypothetical protein